MDDSTPKHRRSAARIDENLNARKGSSFSPTLPKKRVLGERNGFAGMDIGGTPTELKSSSPILGSRSVISPCSPSPALLDRSKPYDPKINYTTPRPEFLRYNPERRQQILKRMEEERDVGSEATSLPSSNSRSSMLSEGSSVKQENGDAEIEAPRYRRRFRMFACRLFLFAGAAAFLACFLLCATDSTTILDQQELEQQAIKPEFLMLPGMKLEDASDIGGNDDTVADLVHEPQALTMQRPDIRMLSAIGLSDVCLAVVNTENSCAIGDEEEIFEREDIAEEEDNNGKDSEENDRSSGDPFIPEDVLEEDIDVFELHHQIPAEVLIWGKKAVQFVFLVLAPAVAFSAALLYCYYARRSSTVPLQPPLSALPVNSSRSPARQNFPEDISRPAVELLGEFTIADSALLKDNPPETMRTKNYSAKMPGRKEQESGSNNGAVATTPTTVTPLRRSSRLRNRVISP